MPRVETLPMFGCPNDRCQVKWWPVEGGDRCPLCDGPGLYIGTVVKAGVVGTVPEEDDTAWA